jgi:GDP-L-fucose synthase
VLDLTQAKVLVTGGNGFLGKAVCAELLRIGCEDVYSPPSREYDLRIYEQAHKMFFDYSPDVVINLAARCGGIGANMAAPGEFFYQNLMMGANVIECSRKFRVRKLVQIGTACSYPENVHRPLVESDLWRGYPEKTNAPYGIAKRCLGEMLKAYWMQHKLQSAYVIPANLYGPHDNFDPQSSHVIPAMIRKFDEASNAGEQIVQCWGTGRATRDFLYVEDAARGIVLAAATLETPEPVNLGTGTSVTMTDLAYMIGDACGFQGSITWDATKPDGQPVRIVGTERQWGDWKPETGLKDGIRTTVKWYRETAPGGRNSLTEDGTAA